MKLTPWDYLTWTVRWRFSPKEADEILDDYRELLAGRPPEDVRQVAADFGRPTEYGLWLARFWGMAACLLLPWLWMMTGRGYQPVPTAVLAVIGAGLALTFREKRSCGRALWGMLAVQAVLLFATFALLAFFITYVEKGDNYLPTADIGPLLAALLHTISLAAALLGLAGLVLTRVEDRRWRGVYTLGLTVLVVNMCLLGVLGSMDVSSSVPIADLWRFCMRTMAPAAAVGAAVTGAALC